MSDDPRAGIRAYLSAHPWSQCSDAAREVGKTPNWTRYRLETDPRVQHRRLPGCSLVRYALTGAPAPEVAPPTAAERRRIGMVARLAEAKRRHGGMEREERFADVERVRRKPCIGCGTTWRRSPMRVVPIGSPECPEGADIGGRRDIVPVCGACLAAWKSSPRVEKWARERLRACAEEVAP